MGLYLMFPIEVVLNDEFYNQIDLDILNLLNNDFNSEIQLDTIITSFFPDLFKL